MRKIISMGTAVLLCIITVLATVPNIVQAEAAAPIRISCVGDSLTFGYVSSNPNTQSYPAQLQKLLGDGYQVSNYGVSGTTMLKDSSMPYWNEGRYQASLTSNPDIVILMLGTNDSKDAHWGPHKDKFVPDMKELIETYRNLPTNPEVYIGLSPRLTVDKVMLLVNSVIENEIVPLQRAVAEELGCQVIDIHGLSKNMPDEDFKDCVHPTDTGYHKIANYIYGELTGQNVEMEIINDSDTEEGRRFVYQGSEWASGNTSGSLNGLAGDEHYAVVTESNAEEHTYEIEFTGTRIQVYGHRSPSHGIVKYSIDGQEAVEASSYGASRSGNELFFQAGGLSNGPHILKAVATGKKDAGGQNAVIQVDYAKVFVEEEKVPPCTCSIENLVLEGQKVEIPAHAESKEVVLRASSVLSGDCKVKEHVEEAIQYEYSILEDPGNAGSMEGNILTVSKPGMVRVMVKAVMGEAEDTATAEIEISKEEVIRCTCDLNITTFAGRQIVIPGDEASKDIVLQATAERTGDCKMEGHVDAGIKYHYAIEKGVGYGVINGNVLTVFRPGTIMVRVTAAVNGKEAQKEAEFGVAKEQVPDVLLKPDKPSRLKGSANQEKSVKISWKKVEGAAGYLIYRYNPSAKKWIRIKKVSSNNYVDSKLKAATVYRYKVKAYNQKGSEIKEGDFSSVLTTATKPKKPVLKVKALSGTKVKLSWGKKKGSDGYEIYMKTGNGSYKWVKHKGAKATSHVKAKLKKGRNYTFRMRGFKKAGGTKINGSYSRAVTVKLR